MRQWGSAAAAATFVAAVALNALVAEADVPAPARSAPNIVLIVADDLGYGDIGAYGSRQIRTPSIDALARSGMRFTDAYASANVCSPSRAGLMTGRYAMRSGLAWKVVSANDERGMPASEETIAELAKRAGYRTALIGKWHLGHRPEYSPLRHGFDRFFGVPHSNDMPGFVLIDDGAIVDENVDQSTLTQHYTEQATRFIEDAGSEPFLLVMSHTFPHIPLYASDGFRGRSAAGLYGDTIEELDWSTGSLLQALSDAGVRDSTLVVFTSDNGPFFEGSSGGLRGGKGNSWDGGYRVPFIVSWPDGVKPNQVSDSITMNIDILPTIAELVGLPPQAGQVDGRSLVPVLRDPDAAIHDRLLLFVNEEVVGLRTRDWKYVTHAYYTGSLGAFEKFDTLPGFDGRYEMLLKADGDAPEAYSYADRYPEKTAELRSMLEAARREFEPLRTRAPQPTYPQ